LNQNDIESIMDIGSIRDPTECRI